MLCGTGILPVVMARDGHATWRIPAENEAMMCRSSTSFRPF